jgi:TatD DNase family protein
LVIHGFNKSKELGEQLMHQGFYLSFGKAILHGNAAAVELIQSTDEFFLETDDSEHSIQEIYKEAAKIKNCSVDELKALIFANWKKLNLI